MLFLICLRKQNPSASKLIYVWIEMKTINRNQNSAHLHSRAVVHEAWECVSPKNMLPEFKNIDWWRSGATFTLHARSIELNRHSMRLGCVGIEIMHLHSCACVRCSQFKWVFPRFENKKATTKWSGVCLLNRYGREKCCYLAQKSHGKSKTYL